MTSYQDCAFKLFENCNIIKKAALPAFVNPLRYPKPDIFLKVNTYHDKFIAPRKLPEKQEAMIEG
tara:strand:- start:98365 stop:98559 length:195 start_codon:yes stop_codon:yes gene_type:complete